MIKIDRKMSDFWQILVQIHDFIISALGGLIAWIKVITFYEIEINILTTSLFCPIHATYLSHKAP